MKETKEQLKQELDKLQNEYGSLVKEVNAIWSEMFRTQNWEVLNDLQSYGDRLHDIFLKMQKVEEQLKQFKKKKKSVELPDELFKYDNYDAYELSKTEYIDPFIEEYEEYIFNGGLFGAPITSLDKYYKGLDSILDIVECIVPFYKGKALYKRIIYRVKPDFYVYK